VASGQFIPVNVPDSEPACLLCSCKNINSNFTIITVHDDNNGLLAPPAAVIMTFAEARDAASQPQRRC